MSSLEINSVAVVGAGEMGHGDGILFGTDDVIEGISAFFQKRKPEFKGK